MKQPKNDYAIFFRLPSGLVDQIDAAAYNFHMTRTQYIRTAICKALNPIAGSGLGLHQHGR